MSRKNTTPVKCPVCGQEVQLLRDRLIVEAIWYCEKCQGTVRKEFKHEFTLPLETVFRHLAPPPKSDEPIKS